MGPRSGERGNNDVAMPTSSVHSSLQWGHVQVNVETEEAEDRHAGSQDQLQWGHVQVNVETPDLPVIVTNNTGASMGPRSGERGNVVPLLPPVHPRQASMGPRSGERGNVW